MPCRLNTLTSIGISDPCFAFLSSAAGFRFRSNNVSLDSISTTVRSSFCKFCDLTLSFPTYTPGCCTMFWPSSKEVKLMSIILVWPGFREIFLDSNLMISGRFVVIANSISSWAVFIILISFVTYSFSLRSTFRSTLSMSKSGLFEYLFAIIFLFL